MVRSSPIQPLPSSHAHYSRETLASECDVSPSLISDWVKKGLISPARGGPSPRSKYYTDDHVRQIKALRAVKDNNAPLTKIGEFLRDTGSTIIQYARDREIPVW